VRPKKEAVVAEDGPGAAPAFPPGPDAQEREVRGAAAEVADEKQLVALEAALMVAGGPDRLVLEAHPAEAGVRERGAQAGERERLVLGARGADEADGSSDDRLVQGLAEGGLRLLAKAAEQHSDQLLEPVTPAEDLRGREQAARQERLHRLDETAAVLVPLQVGDERGRPGEALDRGLRVLSIEVEQRAERGRRPIRPDELREPRGPTPVHERQRTVRRAEVHPERRPPHPPCVAPARKA
jgi:hypothetical protein